MQKIYFVVFFLLLSFWSQAQERFLDPMFNVDVERSVPYGNNISILTGAPLPQDLVMDVYTPMDDTNTSRPVILIAHTGSFLPPLFNGGITGATTDSTTVVLCRELASRGYVAIAYTYRLGWLPTSPDQNVRTATLLQAAYRGIQDTRTAIRYLRRTVAEDGNPMGIDPDNIGVGGVGTGGYLALGAGTLYDFEEVTLDKFIDDVTLTPFIDSTIFGNLFGDTDAALCTANHPGFNSEVDFVFNMGGALGDENWVDGGDVREAMITGVHATNDIFAPFTNGPVIVPTTNEFVVNVAGTHAAVSAANATGRNDRFTDILNDPLRPLMEEQITRTFPLPGTNPPINTQLGAENFYAFETPFPEGSPWNWWDLETLRVIVAATNDALGTTFDADELNESGLATNSDMSAEKGRAHIDTLLQLVLPRACVAFELGCEGVLSTVDIVQHDLIVSPNPAINQFNIQVSDAVIRSVQMLDISGKVVLSQQNIDNNTHQISRIDLNSGIYLLNVVFDDGIQTIKVMIE